MSVRNIEKGYYTLLLTPTSLDFNGAATETIKASVSVIDGTVTMFIPAFSVLCTSSGYLRTQIPVQYLPNSSTISYSWNVFTVNGTVTSPGVITLNMNDGLLRIYPDYKQYNMFQSRKNCGLFDNVTLVWNIV